MTAVDDPAAELVAVYVNRRSGWLLGGCLGDGALAGSLDTHAVPDRVPVVRDDALGHQVASSLTAREDQSQLGRWSTVMSNSTSVPRTRLTETVTPKTPKSETSVQRRVAPSCAGNAGQVARFTWAPSARSSSTTVRATAAPPTTGGGAGRVVVAGGRMVAGGRRVVGRGRGLVVLRGAEVVVGAAVVVVGAARRGRRGRRREGGRSGAGERDG